MDYQEIVKELNTYTPKRNWPELLQKNKNIKLYSKDKNHSLYKLVLEKKNFRINIFFQIINNKISNTFIKFPSYFLHDRFLEIFLKENKVKSIFKNNTRLYQWEKDGFNWHYSATCTITCFPIYLSIEDKSGPTGLLSLFSI